MKDAHKFWCSIVQPRFAWIYSDETTEAIRQLFDSVADTGAIVRLEVANSLTVVVRRGRIDCGDSAGRRSTIWR